MRRRDPLRLGARRDDVGCQHDLRRRDPADREVALQHLERPGGTAGSPAASRRPTAPVLDRPVRDRRDHEHRRRADEADDRAAHDGARPRAARSPAGGCGGSARQQPRRPGRGRCGRRAARARPAAASARPRAPTARRGSRRSARLMKIVVGTISMPTSATTTVMPLNSTARLAVPPAASIAARACRAGRPLLAVAGDDEQHVVDADREAHHRDHVRHEERQLEDLADERGQRQRDDDRDARQHQRQQGRDERAEHDQQDHERDRDADRLAASDEVASRRPSGRRGRSTPVRRRARRGRRGRPAPSRGRAPSRRARWP